MGVGQPYSLLCVCLCARAHMHCALLVFLSVLHIVKNWGGVDAYHRAAMVVGWTEIASVAVVRLTRWWLC